MPSFGSETGNVLYLIVCGAPSAVDTMKVVREKQECGWDVCVVATPSGAKWLDKNEVKLATGRDVRIEFRDPGDEPFRPLGDAVVVSPATFNTINKWALGINDTLALGLLNEALGATEVRIDVYPEVNSALSTHPRYLESIRFLGGSDAVTVHKAPFGRGDS